MAAAVPAAPAVPTTIPGFLGFNKVSMTNLHLNSPSCKAKFCASQIGSLVNNGMLPISGITGGLIGGCCPTVPTPAQLAAAERKAARKAWPRRSRPRRPRPRRRSPRIEYLATVDCRYWPDAEKALIDRLRADRNECVRYAAARAMGTGCCCTKKTLAALKLVVEGADTDGNPSERSERVKSASWYALGHCVNRYVPSTPAPRERPSEPPRREYPAGYDPNPRAASYEEIVANTPDAVLVSEARRVLAASARVAPLGDQTMPTGSRSVFQALQGRFIDDGRSGSGLGSGPGSGPGGRHVGDGAPRGVVIRSTAPPYFARPAAIAPPAAPPAAPDPSVRRAGVEAPRAPGRRPPRSLLELFSASRRPRPGA